MPMVTCAHPTEPFEDTASTCGVATLDVKSVAGDDWRENDKSDVVSVMHRQAVPRCRVCKSRPAVPGQSICESCATVGW